MRLEDCVSSDSKTEGEKQHIQGKCSSVRAVFNLLLSAIGCGVVSLPKQFAETGYIGGTVAMVLGMILANAALLRLEYAIQNQSVFVESYEHLALLLFGKAGKRFTAVIVHGTIGACAAGLLIIIGQATQHLFDKQGVFSNISVTVLLTSLPLLPLSWLKNMHEASYVALVGTVAVFALVLIIVIAGFKQIAANSSDATRPEVQVSSLTGSITHFLMAISVCVFSFNTANTAPSLIHDMRQPANFRKAVLAAALLIFTIYLAIALAGYLAWGADVKKYDSVITLVMSQKNSYGLGMATAITVLFLAYPHYVVLFVPVATAVEHSVSGKIPSQAIRSLVWALTVAFAAAVGSFNKVVDIVAGVAMPFIALLLPVTFYWRTKLNKAAAGGLSIADLGVTGVIFTLGLGLLANGLYTSGKSIIDLCS